MSGNRVAVRNCSDLRDHPIHVQTSMSTYSCDDGAMIDWLCPGGRVGEKRVRDAVSLRDLVMEVKRDA